MQLDTKIRRFISNCDISAPEWDNLSQATAFYLQLRHFRSQATTLHLQSGEGAIFHLIGCDISSKATTFNLKLGQYI